MSILCVQVTCKVRRSRKPDDSCKPGTYLPFWNRGQMFARDHSLGISPLSIDCWKCLAYIGPNSVANSFKTLGWSSSGPKAFEGFRPFCNFVTPSLVTTMSSMNGTDLSRRGTWLCSLLVNTSVNWPLNSLAFPKSDWARPPPCLFFKGGNTLGIYFLTVYVTIKIPRISLHITNQVIHIQIMLLPNIAFDFPS